MVMNHCIVSILKESLLFPTIDAAYFFGSRAAGKASTSSDYDIAILFNPQHIPNFEQQLELRSQLEEALGTDVDLLILNNAPPIISMQAINKGRLILDVDELRRAFFIATLYSQYSELKEMRMPMEKNILKRKYYG